ncbi:MAG TPA: chemotaxis protein CheB [Candidatus Elarobacter sp.]|jgi:two-component system chemotaxis response regulator CheB|nr:chemotaxis protein CheB [Candidatus Elarobacter sp.]
MPARYVVVIGASAGGLEGLTRIVRDLEPRLHAAFFVVVHLPPAPPSRLALILGRATRCPTAAVAGREPIEAGRIYVAPANRHLVVEPGWVTASDAPTENRHRPSIDMLFRSAALAYLDRTIGVVLSGTLDDGTAGLRWIKRCDGCAIVQDPDEAPFAAMPSSAIANVEVDRVLPAGRIAAAIAEIVEAPATA